MTCRPISAVLVCVAVLVGAGWPAIAPADGAGAYVGRSDGGERSKSRLKHRASHLEARRKHIRARLRVGGRGEEANDAASPIVVIERPPEPEAEPVPPDPAAPFAHLRARGHAGATPLAPGDTLPEGLAYVTLNWRTYDLPRPPAGEVYARIGRAVYRIEPEAGRVTARIAPGAAGGG